MLLCPWDSTGKKNRVGCHALLQRIFLTQGWNLCLQWLLLCRWILYPLSHLLLLLLLLLSHFSHVRLCVTPWTAAHQAPLSLGFPRSSVVKTLPAKQEWQETQVPSLGQEDPLKEGMATHSSILA